MFELDGETYCQYFIGVGTFDPNILGQDAADKIRAGEVNDIFFMPNWRKSRIDLSVTNFPNWGISAGLTYSDEPHAQENDLCDFLSTAYRFLDQLINFSQNGYTFNVGATTDKRASMCVMISHRTAALLGALGVDYNIYWSSEGNKGDLPE